MMKVQKEKLEFDYLLSSRCNKSLSSDSTVSEKEDRRLDPRGCLKTWTQKNSQLGGQKK